jgi:hypothetical protein
MELLAHNIETNYARAASSSATPDGSSHAPAVTHARATILDWNEPLPTEVLEVDGGFDLIMCVRSPRFLLFSLRTYFLIANFAVWQT